MSVTRPPLPRYDILIGGPCDGLRRRIRPGQQTYSVLIEPPSSIGELPARRPQQGRPDFRRIDYRLRTLRPHPMAAPLDVFVVDGMTNHEAAVRFGLYLVMLP